MAALVVLLASSPSLLLTAPPRLAPSQLAPQRRGATVAMQESLVALPPAAFEGAVAAGVKKASMPPGKIFGLGIMSGAQIGFGVYLMLSVGGACPGLAATNPGLKQIILGAFGLPLGLFMTLMSGAELFTGNTALVTAAAYEGKVAVKDLGKSWACSYAGNFVGSVLLALLVTAGGTLGPTGGAAAVVSVAKTSLPFGQAVARGVLCNWLVCMAVYMASMARDVTGKMVAIWFPISAFIALGLEHSVANMFLVPFGIFNGAAVTWKAFLLNNLLPVTLGNIIAGTVCVAGAFSWAYGTLGKKH